MIVTYPRVPDSHAEADLIAEFLKAKGFDAPYGSIYDEELRTRVKNNEFDVLIAVGGDGTMLRAGHLCAPCGVPILGINLGRLGFLIQIERGEWREMLERLFKGEAWIEYRMMLYVRHIRAGEMLGSWHALNEAVVSRGQNQAAGAFIRQRGWTLAHIICLRWLDCFDRHRFDGVRTGGGRPHPAARAAKHLTRSDCASSLGGPRRGSFGRFIGQHYGERREHGSERGWSGADAVGGRGSRGYQSRGIHGAVRTLWRSWIFLSQLERAHEYAADLALVSIRRR